MVWCCDYCGRELDETVITTPYGHFCCQHCADGAEEEMNIDRHSSKHRDPLNMGKSCGSGILSTMNTWMKQAGGTAVLMMSTKLFLDRKIKR